MLCDIRKEVPCVSLVREGPHEEFFVSTIAQGFFFPLALSYLKFALPQFPALSTNSLLDYTLEKRLTIISPPSQYNVVQGPVSRKFR